jgi:hypothetical protein
MCMCFHSCITPFSEPWPPQGFSPFFFFFNRAQASKHSDKDKQRLSMSNPFWYHQNDIIWAPNVLLLTLLGPILVIAAFPHFSYAGNTHNNHIIVSLRRTSRNHVRFKPPPPSLSARCIQALFPLRTPFSTRSTVHPLLRVSPPPPQQRALFRTPKTTTRC